MTTQHRDNRLAALASVLGAVGLASTQDAITKAMPGEYSAYATAIFRCIGSYPLLLALLIAKSGWAALATSLWRTVLLRSFVLCTTYFGFVLAISLMPIADAVAIYFTMPFFVAGFAGPLLGERVRLHRWLAIIAAFIGVLIMVRPGASGFEPSAFFALYSTLG
jgi:drug/metabolite transporter (DMT)-like permease